MANNIFYSLLFTVILLMFTDSLTYAQNEIPEKIKDKITAGINALETSKSPEDVEKAVKEFTDAIAIAPEYPDVHYFLGKTLSMMQGNAGKALKEYLKYLEMYPDAPDKVMLYEEIGKMKEVIAEKRKSSLSGVEFINTSDGIYVRYLYPFSPANKQYKVGDKIVSLGGKDIAAKTSLYYFLKLVDDYPSDNIPVSIIRGGKEQEIVMNKTAKSSDKNIKELGEEDLNDIINTSDKPVVVVFWTSWCGPCIKYAPVLRDFAGEYGNSVLFISVSMDENKSAGKEFEIVNIPVTSFYKNGKLVEKILGFKESNKDLIKEKIKSIK